MKPTLALALLLSSASFTHAADWSRFRGPNGSGVAQTTGLPSAIDDNTTVWKIELGKGWSSPVLWKDLVIVTAEDNGDAPVEKVKKGKENDTKPGKRAVIALGAKDGKVRWKYEEPYTVHHIHEFNSFASSTPFVNEQGIFVNWSSGNVIQALALDHTGKRMWHNDHVANYVHEHGTGSSPVVVDGIMVVRSEFDTQKNGKPLTDDPAAATWKNGIFGLDATTGKQVWALELPNCLNTFSTPVVRDVPGSGQKELIVSDTVSGVMGIDAKTGKMNWQHNPGYKQRSLGSAAFANGIYFTTFGSGGGGKETAALDLTGAQPKPLDFNLTKGLPYVPTPLVMDGYMYLLGDGGILQCVEAKTGKPVYEERLNGTKGSSKFFSSPVAGDGKIFCGSQQGDVIVVQAGPKFQQLGASKLDSAINATSAIGDGRIFVRTEKMLWCAGAKTLVP
jgi:outer membrane protein assembly factor BamB